MYYIEKTSEFDKWLKKMPDLRAKAKVLFRLQKLENDEHFGDFKSVGEGIIELRIDYAQGYRIYLKEKVKKLIILLLGGVKSTQNEDIKKAKAIWRRINT